MRLAGQPDLAATNGAAAKFFTVGAATTQRFNAVLVHKDPEFDALKGVIQLQPLPPKTGAAVGTP
jgi:hypothetical protein